MDRKLWLDGWKISKKEIVRRLKYRWEYRNCLATAGFTSQAGTAVEELELIVSELTFKHRASSIQDRPFATLQRTLFIYLINKYISLSDICLAVHQ